MAVLSHPAFFCWAQPVFQESGQLLISIQGNWSQDVALGDLDGNGTIDAIVAQGGSPIANVIWLNDGNGTFSEATQTVGAGDSPGLALGDLDGDGDLDVWVANLGDDEIWLNQGGAQGGTQGTFANSQLITNSFSDAVVLGDLDGDLDLDAAVLTSGSLGIWWNTNGGQFVAGPSLPSAAPYSIALADLDGDNDLDIITGGEGFFLPSLIIWNDWNTSEAFTDGPQLLMDGIANGIAVADLDHDGFTDIFMATTAEDQVWWNNGDGTFAGGDLLSNGNNVDVALADIDGDGDQDAVVVRGGLGGAANGYLINNGDRSFSLAPQTVGNDNSYAVAAGDLNGDGRPDVFVANSGPNEVWLNIAEPLARPGVFVDSGQFLEEFYPGLALGDVDGDGDPDVVTGGRCPTIWINQGGMQGGTPAVFARGISPSDSPCGAILTETVALGDLDGDSDLDIFAVGHWENKVWINEGGIQGGTQGIFVDSGQLLGQAYSEEVALEDFDGDGDLDALVLNFFEAVRIWVNQGGAQAGLPGRFVEQVLSDIAEPSDRNVAVGDVDGDGDIDAIVTDISDVYIYQNQGGDQAGKEGEFAAVLIDLPRVYYLRGFRLGDIDGDADLDLFMGSGFDDTVWINQGGNQGGVPGAFGQSGQVLRGATTKRVALADLNDDGAVDAFLACNGDSQAWTNDGNGGFYLSQVLGGNRGRQVDLSDLDGDGDLDAVVTASPAGARIWLNGEPNRLPVMFYDIQLEPAPDGDLVYNWWGRGNAILPIRLTQAADTEITIDVQGTYDLDGYPTISPVETIVFPPGSTLQTATIFPEEVGGRPGEIWNIYQGTEEIDQDRVRCTVILSNLTAGVTLSSPGVFYLDFRNPDFGNRACVLNGILTLTEAAGGGGFAPTSVGSGSGDPLSLDSYRAFRDDVLAGTAQGRYFIDLYEQNSPDILQTISDQSWLVPRAVSVIQTWAPAFQALVGGYGDDVTVTPAMLAEGLDFIEELRTAAPPGLQAVIDAEKSALSVESWVDLAMTDVLAQVESRRIPGPFTRLTLANENGTYLLRWWGETGTSYRIEQSEGDVQAFLPVSEWLSGNGERISVLLSPPAATVTFYRLEVLETVP